MTLIATRTSWTAEPLPTERVSLSFEASYTEAQFAQLQRGLVPQGEDDRWFIFYETPWLYCHRSWTGHALYWLRLEQRDSQHCVVEVWASRDPLQYCNACEDRDVAGLSALLESRLKPKEPAQDSNAAAPKRSWWRRLFGRA